MKCAIKSPTLLKGYNLQAHPEDLTPSGRKHLDYLDGWRGIAIILVLIGHFTPVEGINLGRLGVAFFFVLSGRLMADILFVRRMQLLPFFLRRFSRVYPGLLFFVVIAGILCDAFTRIKVGILAALTALTFTINYTSIFYHHTGLYDHLWSLCIEEHSYIVLGFLAWLDRCKKLDTRVAILVIGVLAVINGIIQTAMGYEYFDVYWRTDVECAPIFLAAFFFLFFRSRKIKHVAWLLPAFLLLAVLLNIDDVPDGVKYSLGTFCLVMSLNLLDEAAVFYKKILGFAPLRQVGLWSYSLYLWQQPFFQLNELQNSDWNLPLAIGAGLLGFYLIENPLRRALNKQIEKHVSHAC